MRAAWLLLALGACSSQPTGSSPSAASPSSPSPTEPDDDGEGTAAAPSAPEGRAEAVFAGGCFWCMERPFEELPGVDSVESGYTGGPERHPTYEQVSSHSTGHYEAVRIVYDPTRVTYERLLDVFFHNVDPTQSDGQFCDRGHQYRSAIFVRDDDERRMASAAKARVATQLDATVATEILDASTFWLAEGYHQDFYRTSPIRYATYRRGCGRDARLEELWGSAAAH